MYEGTIEISMENALQLLALADLYVIKELKKSASEFLIGNIVTNIGHPILLLFIIFFYFFLFFLFFFCIFFIFLYFIFF